MRRSWIAFILVAFIVFAFAQANASISMKFEASPVQGDGSIKVNDTVLFGAYLYNDWNVALAYSLPLVFYSPNGSITQMPHVQINELDSSAVIIPEDGGGFWYDSSIHVESSWNNLWYVFFNFAGLDWDGVLPDTINATGSGMSGWNTGPDTLLRFSFAVKFTEPGIICVDSCSVPGMEPPGKYDWLFEDANANFGPGNALGTSINSDRNPYCWNVVSTDVEEVDKGMLPTNFELGQNYPNPFNPNTSFGFALPHVSNVNISIFNILGQKVKTLVDQEYSAGYYTADWDGTGDNGTSVASGIYFYKIQADKFSATRKMMLLK